MPHAQRVVQKPRHTIQRHRRNQATLRNGSFFCEHHHHNVHEAQRLSSLSIPTRKYQRSGRTEAQSSHSRGQSSRNVYQAQRANFTKKASRSQINRATSAINPIDHCSTPRTTRAALCSYMACACGQRHQLTSQSHVTYGAAPPGLRQRHL
jgi:hypothetical protein